MSAASIVRRRGSPLMMLALLLTSWIGGRVATWEPPFDLGDLEVGERGVLFADNERQSRSDRSGGSEEGPQSIAYPHYGEYPAPIQMGGAPALAPGGAMAMGQVLYLPVYATGSASSVQYVPVQLMQAGGFAQPRKLQKARGARQSHTDYGRYASPYEASDLSAQHQRLMREAFGVDWHSPGVAAGAALAGAQGDRITPLEQAQAAPPRFGALTPTKVTTPADRWSLDVFGFYRQGSSALNVSQGRTPIYGASQLGANLQWRARPSSAHDPRVFARAYHALVEGGESEIAAGVSARPVGSIPLRTYGELRVTRNPASAALNATSSTAVRPAAYAVTELPPLDLPAGFGLEAYGAAGYVFGKADTYFVDGQAAVTNKVLSLGGPGSSSGALSVGGGIWGGAQKGAARLDVGPTMRLDVNVGDVPARVSVDYRQQVAGDAEPDSGVAATVSTRF